MEYKNLDLSTEVVHGHYDLILEVGNLYDIHYGIHQGVYEYVGKTSKKSLKYEWDSPGQHLFRNCKTGKITFGYYGYTSPYEFSSIVQPHKN